MKSSKTYPRRLESGLLAVDQGIVNGYPLSFNPDTERYHVHDTGGDQETLATFKRRANAVYYARKR